MKNQVRVNQMINNRGNAAANQFILSSANKQVFQSYETLIAEQHNDGKIVLDKSALAYSKTTSKHLFIFLGMDRKLIESRIKEGRIKLKDLNC